MPPTLKGIFHNLRESEYTISNTEIVFFFSSRVYRNKFMDKYIEHRETFCKKANKLLSESPYNMDILADIELYKAIEKRGFFALLKGVSIKWEELHTYALRKMTEKNTHDWQEIPKPKLQGVKRNTGWIYRMK